MPYTFNSPKNRSAKKYHHSHPKPAYLLLSAALLCVSTGLDAEETPKADVLCDQAVFSGEMPLEEITDDIWAQYSSNRDAKTPQQNEDLEQTALNESETRSGCIVKRNSSPKGYALESQSLLYIKNLDLGEASSQVLVGQAVNSKSKQASATNSKAYPIAGKDDHLHQDHSASAKLLKIELYSISFALVVFIIASLGFRNTWKVGEGFLNKRTICTIPAELACQDGVFKGSVTVLGYDSARFVPTHKNDLREIQGLLSKKRSIFFKIEIGGHAKEVFVQKSQRNHISTFFEGNLSAQSHKRLLKLSTTPPRLGQFVSTKPNKKLRRKVSSDRYHAELQQKVVDA